LTEKDDLQVFQIIYKAVFDHNISSFYVWEYNMWNNLA
jgi:hypothetical protein